MKQIEKHEYEVVNTITKEDIERVGDSSIFVSQTCAIVKAMIEDNGKDIRCYLLTCENLEETFEYITYRIFAEQVAELRDGELYRLSNNIV